MLILHHAPMACSLASRMALAESGLEHEVHFIHTTKDENKTPAYLAINPRGKVPALETDRGVLTESTAILPFIADQVPEKRLFPQPGTWERARGQSWLGFLSSGLHCAYTPAFYAHEQADEAKALELAIGKVASVLEQIEHHLEGREYLLDDFSVADLYLATYALWRMSPHFAGKLPRLPNIDSHQGRVIARPALEGIVGEEVRLRSENS